MIYIITTGGTIGGMDYQDVKNKPEDTTHVIEGFFEAPNISFEYEMTEVFNKDSRFITNEDRRVISEKIKSSIIHKILITHGTMTMVKTAKFLGKMNLDKSIVLTGALVLGTGANTDAPFNLGFAICALEFLDKGVYIAMNGKNFSWNNVRKNLKTNRFETLSQ